MPPPIHHTFAPLADHAHCLQAFSLLLQPWKWQEGKETTTLKQELSTAFRGNAFLFSSGREALFALLKSLKLTPGEEVILQGYTCVVVPNAIRAAGMVPVYADIEKKTLNLDLASVETMITPRTRAIICQHTFGIPAPTEALRELCTKRSLLLIEDCAHALPDAQGPADIGSHGDFLLLSFGRDKAISGVTGGAIICRHPEAAPGLGLLETQANPLPVSVIARLLLYPLLYAKGKLLYRVGLGKIFLALCQKLKLLLPIVTTKEKEEALMLRTLHTLPNACAALAFSQWKKLRQFNDHRRTLTAFYLRTCAEEGWRVLHGIRSDLPLQKFPLFIHAAESVRKKLKKENIHLHDGWTGCVVCPPGVNLTEAQYTQGLDPVAEAASEQIFSLPTHPTMTPDQAKRLITALKPFLSQQQ